MERYGALSAPQLTRLLYSPGSLKWVERTLAKMLGKGLLKAVYLGRLPDPDGRPGGKDLRLYARKRGFRIKSQPYLRSVWWMNSVLVTSELLVRVGFAEKVEIRTELSYRRSPLRFGERSFMPDGSSLIHTQDASQLILWEWDDGTEGQLAFRHKMPLLAQYAASEGLTLAVVSLMQSRIQRLRRWAELDLARMNQTGLAEYCFFSSFDPSSADPLEVFTQPIWHCPYEGALVSIW